MTRLKIDVEALHKGPIEFRFEVPPAEFDLLDDPEFRFTGPIAGQFTVKMIGGESVLMSGTLSTAVQADCVRCLHPLDFPVEVTLNAAFLPRPEQRAGEEELVDAEKMYYENGVIHPMERLREEIMVNLPFLPSCVLEGGDFCPVRGVKVGPMVFGPDGEEEELGAQPAAGSSENANSWKDQLARLRRKIDDGKGN